MFDTIRPASVAEVGEIVRVFSECADWLSAQCMHHWVGHHDAKWVTNALSKFEVYVHHDAEGVNGTLMLQEGRVADVDALKTEYLSTPKFGKGPFLWICKVAVRPSSHHSGVGSTLLEYAESIAQARGYEACVLDAVTKNNQLREYYEKRGYIAFGTHHDCTIFEKVLAVKA